MGGRRCRWLLPRRRRGRSSEAASIHIHRIDEFLVRFFRALHRLFEALLENARAVLLALELFLEPLRRLALLRLEPRHHRLQRPRHLHLFRLVQQDFAAEAIDHDRRLAAGAGDFEVGHGCDSKRVPCSVFCDPGVSGLRVHPCRTARVTEHGKRNTLHSSASSKSSTRSSACSSPTDKRSRFSAVVLPGPSLELRCSIRLSTLPREVARVKRRTLAVTARASARVPRTRKESMPPKADIWRRAMSWTGWDSRPG